MIAFFHQRRWHYLLLIGIAGLLFFLNLGGATLWDVDEGRNSGCAFEMMEADNWIVPAFNGQLRVDKPALLYWLQIISYNVFGVNEFAARFPSALAALLTVLAAYELARSMFTRNTGIGAGVIAAATPMLCGAARFANPDALLACCTVVTLTVFWLGQAERRWWWFVLLGVCSGLAVLAKGPVGLVLPFAVNFMYLLWEGRLGILWDRRWLLTSTAFILTAVPWYVWVGLETHGEFLSGFLWRHNLGRGMEAMENHDGFPGFYLAILLVGMAPWSIFIFVAAWLGFWSAIRSPWRIFQSWWSYASEGGSGVTDNAQTASAYRYLFCWIGVYVLFFSVAATKLPNYVLPALVPCAILIAQMLQRWHCDAIRLPAWIQAAAVVSLGLIGVAIFTLVELATGADSTGLFPSRQFVGLEAWALIGAIPVVAAGAGAWFLRRRQAGGFILALAAAAILMLAPLAAFASSLFNHYKAPRSLVEQADSIQRARDVRIGCFQMDHLPSLNFYVQRNIEHLEEPKDVVRFLGYGVPVYLFLPAEHWQELQRIGGGHARIVGRHYDLYHDQDFIVVTNR